MTRSHRLAELAGQIVGILTEGSRRATNLKPDWTNYAALDQVLLR